MSYLTMYKVDNNQDTKRYKKDCLNDGLFFGVHSFIHKRIRFVKRFIFSSFIGIAVEKYGFRFYSSWKVHDGYNRKNKK